MPAFIVTLGTSFIVRGVAYLMCENTTVIGLPAGIRAYGNDALLYYIHGPGGGLYFLNRPDVSGELLRRMDIILPYPVMVTAFVVALAIFLLHERNSAGMPTPSAAAWTPRCAPAFRSIATSLRSISCRPRPPGSPAFSRRCASPRARR